MKITLITVGKLKEKFWREACAEYEKRISPYAKFNVIEVPDEDDDAILNKLPNGADCYSIAMCIEAKPTSSEQLASKVANLQNSGKSHVAIIIGGSCGLSQKVKLACKEQISLGPITLPHNLARIVITEQIYRAFTIIAGKTYHK